MAFWNRVRGYVSGLLGASPPTHSPGQTVSDGPVAEAEPPSWVHLQEMLRQIESARDLATRKEEKGDSDTRRAAALQDEEARAKQHQREMLEDILEMHKCLNTDLDEMDLKGLGLSLISHCDHFKAYNDEKLTHLVMFATMQRFHSEALKHGWEELNARMQAAGVKWPEPTGLSPSADAEERVHAAEMHLKAEYRDFIGGKMMRFKDLMLGIVPVWRAAYPERGSAVWQDTVLTAVAGALACLQHDRIMEIAQAHHVELEQLVGTQLSEQLADIQQRLAGGVSSISTAWSLTEQAVEICQKTTPDLMWAIIAPELERTRALLSS